MTVPDLDRRIEAAAELMHAQMHGGAGKCSYCDAVIRRVLERFAPELFDGSAWLAPWELGAGNWGEWAGTPAKVMWSNVRDAHLAKTEGSGDAE